MSAKELKTTNSKIGERQEKTNTEEINQIAEEDTIPNPNFYFGTQLFKLENGDVFDGGYGCHKNGIIWREGWGVYSTRDGHLYQGVWENDKLLDSPQTAILFPTWHQYLGSIVNGKYSGAGIYILDNQLILTTEFLDNKPAATITLEDYEGHLWQGEPGENIAILRSVNHFFETIPTSRGRGTLIYVPDKQTSPSKVSSAASERSPADADKLKEIVFKKSSKTKNDFKFSETRTKLKNVISKKDISKSSIQLADEASATSKRSEVSITLLKTFLSREYRTRCKVIPIFTPSQPEPNKSQELLQPPIVGSSDNSLAV